jgi:hypothetical protein
MRKTALIAGTAVVVLVILVAGSYLLTRTEVSFELRMQNGVCMPTDPDRLDAVSFQTVLWDVRNVDCPTQFISLRNFKHPTGGGGYDPSETPLDPPAVPGGPIATGATVQMHAIVNPRLLWRLFKYEIWLGTAPGSLEKRLDPDIEIWP